MSDKPQYESTSVKKSLISNFLRTLEMTLVVGSKQINDYVIISMKKTAYPPILTSDMSNWPSFHADQENIYEIYSPQKEKWKKFKKRVFEKCSYFSY